MDNNRRSYLSFGDIFNMEKDVQKATGVFYDDGGLVDAADCLDELVIIEKTGD